MSRNKLLAIIISTLALLSGCQSMAEIKTVPAETEVVNTIPDTVIVSSSYNGYGVGSSSGGGQSCCISLPEKWQPGMMATIEWVKDPNPKSNPGSIKEPKWNSDGTTSKAWKDWMVIHKENYTHHAVRIPVPKYEKVSSLTLIFLPCDQVYPLIDSAQSSYVMGHLPYPRSMRYPEIIRRLGMEASCPQK